MRYLIVALLAVQVPLLLGLRPDGHGRIIYPPAAAKAPRKSSYLLSAPKASSGADRAHESHPVTEPSRHSPLQVLSRSRSELRPVNSLLPAARRRAEYEDVRHLPNHADADAKPLTARLWFWAMGIVITVLGQTIMVPGLFLQKMAHTAISIEIRKQADSAPGEVPSARPYYKEFKWICGIVVYALGQIFCWIGFGMAPQCICACLQSWNIPVSMLLAPWMLGETIPKNAGIYSALLIGGCVWVVVFGPAQDNGGALFTLAVAGDDLLRPVMLLPLGVLSCMYAFVAVAKSQNVHAPQATIYVVISAGCAWYSASLSKCLAMLVVTSTLSGNLRFSLETLAFGLIVAAFIVMAIAQIHFMNMALKHGNAVAIVPLYEGLSMVGQIVFGGILWHEFAEESWRDFFGFLAGVAFVIAGLTLLTQASLENGGFDDLPSDEESSQDESKAVSSGDPLKKVVSPSTSKKSLSPSTSTAFLQVLLPWRAEA